MDQTTFLSFAAKQMNKTYSGDPLELKAFINSINLLKTLGATHHEILITFIMTKLTGKALESVPENPDSIDAIINGLKANIKPDSSKVVEGKMMALKLDTAKATDFATEAEKLAESLQRSLIVEGISQEKAKSMTVDKTVEMCRQTASNIDTRIIIASTTFTDPKDVIAKFVVESATAATIASQNKILKFNKQNPNRKSYWNRKNYRGNYRQNQESYQGNGRNDSNWRGRGRKRGRGRYKNYQNNQNDRYVNVTNAENSSVPSGSRRGTENQVTSFQRVNDN